MVLEDNLVHALVPVHWPKLLVFHIKKNNKYFNSKRTPEICEIKDTLLLRLIRKSYFKIVINGLL